MGSDHLAQNPTTLGMVDLVPGKAHGERELCLLVETASPDAVAQAAWLGCLAPELLQDVLLEVDVFVGSHQAWVLMVLRCADSDWQPGFRSRLGFWARRAGAQVVDLHEDPARRDPLSARVRTAERHQRHLNPNRVWDALEKLLAPVLDSPEKKAFAQRGLVLDIGFQPGRSDLSISNVSTGGMFIQSDEVPLVGDVFQVAISVPSGPPQVVECRVAHIRRPASTGPGKPPGFGISFVNPTAALVETLARFGVTEDGRHPSSGRIHPRYDLTARLRYAENSGFSDDIVSNLSIGGAFIKSSHPAKRGELLNLHIELPGGTVLQTAGTVVFSGADGMGVQFKLDSATERSLAAELSRIACRPRRALVIDPDATSRQTTERLLGAHRVTALTAADGAHGLEVLRDEVVGIDMVVLALVDRNSDTVLVEQLRKVAGSQMPIIAMVTSTEGKGPELVAGVDALVRCGKEPEGAVEESIWLAHQKRLRAALGEGSRR